VGPVQDNGVYEIAKSFAASVAKGTVEAKPENENPLQAKPKKILDL
jgi:hypothetical protein